MAKKKMTGAEKGRALQNWTTCNDALRKASEDEALELLEFEKSGASRPQYLLRCHARFNKLRGQRERKELLS